MSLYRDFDIMDINAQGVWTNEHDGTPAPGGVPPVAGPVALPDGPRDPRRDVRRRPRIPRRLLGLLLGMGAVGAVAYFGFDPRLELPATRSDRPISVPVQRGTLRITVTERGNLESRVTVDGVCELSGYQNKIIQLVPEGNKVEKGDVVVRFDSAEIEKNIAQQDIKAKQALSKIETSKQEVEIAKNKGESEDHRSQGRVRARRARPREVPEGGLSSTRSTT